jgi:hypothetical protein
MFGSLADLVASRCYEEAAASRFGSPAPSVRWDPARQALRVRWCPVGDGSAYAEVLLPANLVRAADPVTGSPLPDAEATTAAASNGDQTSNNHADAVAAELAAKRQAVFPGGVVGAAARARAVAMGGHGQGCGTAPPTAPTPAHGCTDPTHDHSHAHAHAHALGASAVEVAVTPGKAAGMKAAGGARAAAAARIAAVDSAKPPPSLAPAPKLAAAGPAAGSSHASTGSGALNDAGPVPVSVEARGNYAVRIRWSDGFEHPFFAYDALVALALAHAPK